MQQINTNQVVLEAKTYNNFVPTNSSDWWHYE